MAQRKKLSAQQSRASRSSTALNGVAAKPAKEQPRRKHEEALLRRIHAALREDVRTRYEDLVRKRRAETLTPDEQAELLRLTTQVEGLQASRIEAMASLAELRRQPLAELREDLEQSGWHPWLTN